MKAGTRDEHTVARGVDLLPTFAGILGVKKPAGSVGIDLSPALRGQPVTKRPDLFWAYGKEGRPMLGKPSQPIDVSPRFAVREGGGNLSANDRSEERRVVTDGDRTCRSVWSPYT